MSRRHQASRPDVLAASGVVRDAEGLKRRSDGPGGVLVADGLVTAAS